MRTLQPDREAGHRQPTKLTRASALELLDPVEQLRIRDGRCGAAPGRGDAPLELLSLVVVACGSFGNQNLGKLLWWQAHEPTHSTPVSQVFSPELAQARMLR